MKLQRVGFSGHQTMSAETVCLVRDALRVQLGSLGQVTGLCSLAAGADQLFAQALLELGNALEVLVPSVNYESTFREPATLNAFYELKARAAHVAELGALAPTEQAFFDAGKEVVRRSDFLIAVWDGEPAAGLGGTADVVDFAHGLGKGVIVIWPEGSTR